MSEAEQLYAWRDDRLVRCPTTPPSPNGLPGTSPSAIVLADSWRVVDGQVRAISLHRQRFVGDVIAQSMWGSEELQKFWDAAMAVVPERGEWFPRVEVTHCGDGVAQLAVRVRPAPARQSTAVVATAQGPDIRTDPSRKGPDLLALLRVRASVAPAQEAILVSEAGYVVDGATTAIWWWRGDALACPPIQWARVDSITSRLVKHVAAQRGIAIREEAARPCDLDGAEVWLVNALHGVRSVSFWIDGPAVAPDTGRAAQWEEALGQLAREQGPWRSTPAR